MKQQPCRLGTVGGNHPTLVKLTAIYIYRYPGMFASPGIEPGPLA